MDDSATRRFEPGVLHFMPDVTSHRQILNALDKQWIRITLTGKINCSRVASTLLDFMEGTQEKFLSLQDNLLQSLVSNKFDKITQEMAGLSQVAIDILKRNLFERTADVGFLATDDAIVNFLLDDSGNMEMREQMEERLLAYRDKYTVYEEILIFDVKGHVRANLDKTSKISLSIDSILAETLSIDGYLESFKTSDMRPEHGDVLLYSQRIMNPSTGEPLGVLCLGFDFKGEMTGIYNNLLHNNDAILCILDEHGKVISSSDQNRIHVGTTQQMVLNEQFKLLNINSVIYLAKTAKTNGYQGFIGLPWFGHVLYPVASAFRVVSNGQSNFGDARMTKLFSGALREIDETADDILSDLGLVVLNGEVMAAKQIVNADPIIRQEANALPPILGAIHQVGESIRRVFADSISSLLGTVFSSRINDAEFVAALSIDIMDRNLYERANDCRWWALNGTFRDVMAKDILDQADRKRLTEILEYINSLYTVYSNLIIYNKDGVVVAVSDSKQTALVGKQLTNEFIAACLRLTSTQQYCVSSYAPTPLYAAQNSKPRHTYIYNAPIFHPQLAESVIGGIAIVFDSEPQFYAMLEDALPRDDEGAVQKGCTGFFISKERVIISTTSAKWNVGDILPLPLNLVNLEHGQKCTEIISIGDERYIVGCAMSNGYREFKRDGIYNNEVIGVIMAEI